MSCLHTSFAFRSETLLRISTGLPRLPEQGQHSFGFDIRYCFLDWWWQRTAQLLNTMAVWLTVLSWSLNTVLLMVIFWKWWITTKHQIRNFLNNLRAFTMTKTSRGLVWMLLKKLVHILVKSLWGLCMAMSGLFTTMLMVEQLVMLRCWDRTCRLFQKLFARWCGFQGLLCTSSSQKLSCILSATSSIWWWVWTRDVSICLSSLRR